MQHINTVVSACGTTTTITNTVTNQTVVVASGIVAALAATQQAPQALAAVANAYANSCGTKGTPAHTQAGKALRVAVQQLAQPGQYAGSMCLGALASTQIAGTSRCQIQWLAPAATRKPLTRNGGNGGNGQTAPVSQAPTTVA